MPGGVCGECNRHHSRHALSCSRWRARTQGRNRTSGYNRPPTYAEHVDPNDYRTTLHVTAMPAMLLIRSQVSTGVVVLAFGEPDTTADLRQRAARAAASSTYHRYPDPTDLPRYEVIDRATYATMMSR